MARASRTKRAASPRNTQYSQESSAFRGASNDLSRDARAFGSMDLHDTLSDHSLPAISGDVDDADEAGHTPSDSAPHRNQVTLTSLSNLGPEHARRSQRLRGSAGGGASTVSENDATRILERIFSMSSRPSQSPPVLDIADAAADGKSCVPGLGTPNAPSNPHFSSRGLHAPLDQMFSCSMRTSSMPHAGRSSCPQLGNPAQPSLSSLSLMPPAFSQVCGQHTSGPNFLLPSSPMACPTRELQPSPPATSYMPLPLQSRASSRCRAPSRGSDADVSSSLDSSPERCQPPTPTAYTPFPVHAETPSPDAPSAPLSVDIGSSTSLSSLSDADLSTAGTSSDGACSSAPMSDVSCVDGARGGTSSPAAASSAASSGSCHSKSPVRASKGSQSGTSGTSGSAYSSPTGKVSRGIAPAELFRSQPKVLDAPQTVNSGEARATLSGTDSLSSTDWRFRCARRRLGFREHVAVGLMSLLPELSTVSTVLLTASGVMGLAYSSAVVHTLIREQRATFPHDPAMTGLLLAAELFFLLSSILQWWLIAGAGTTLDHLTWATQPAQRVPLACLPQLYAPQLVLSAAHRATRLGLAGQAMGSLVLTVAVGHIMLSGSIPLPLDIILLTARFLVAACNLAFLWEALYARRRHALTKCPLGATSAALDSELYLLASCLLFLVWQVLHSWVTSGSVVFLTILVSVHCGGASLLRSFGATLLLWGTGTRLSDSPEASKIHTQLKAWCPHHLLGHASNKTGMGRPAQAEYSPTTSFAAEYIAAVVTVAANLVVPCALSRAMALQAISGCRACMNLVLRARDTASDEALAGRLEHMLHLVLEAAAIVRNHNQHRCGSIVFAREPGQQEAAALPSLATLKVAPAHLRCLHARENVQVTAAPNVHLCISDTLAMVLSLGSHIAKAGASASTVLCRQHVDRRNRGLRLLGNAVCRDLAVGQRQQDDGSSEIVSCEMRTAPQRTQEDSFAHSMGLSAACLSSQLRGRSPSAQLTMHQHSCSALQPSNARGRHIGNAEAASGTMEQLDAPGPTSNSLQPHRLAVSSAYSSFKVAPALQPSDEATTQADCAAELSSSHSTTPHGLCRLTAAYAVAVCMASESTKAAGLWRAAKGARVAVSAVKLTADDVAEVCRSIEPCCDGDMAGGADTLVHVRVVPSSSVPAATQGAEAPALQAAAADAARQSFSKGHTIASPRALQQLMDAVMGAPQVVDVAADLCYEAKESQAAGDTADLAAKTFESPAMRASMLHHVYSASPEGASGARAGASSTVEIQHASAMSLCGPAMVRGQALSAAISQAASAERAAENTAALAVSPRSDTTSIRSHGMPRADTPERTPLEPVSQGIADSAWINVGAMRKDGGSSSGLMHGDSSGAWVCQNRKPPWTGNGVKTMGRLQGSQGVSTDSSGQSLGAPSRSYLRQDPRHRFRQAGAELRDGSLPARKKWEPPTEEGEEPSQEPSQELSQSMHINGAKDSESTEMQVAEAGGSMMLPLPPVMSTFL